MHHGVDGYGAVGKDARNVGEHAGPVEHAHAQVVRGHHLLHGQDYRRRKLVGLEGEVRHALLRIGGVHARHINQVCHHRRCGGLGTGAGTVVHGGADGVALDEDRVHHALDIGDQPARRDQRRVDAQLDALGRLARDAQQLDAVAQLLGVTDVFLRQLGDALGIGFFKLHRDAKGDG